MASKFHEWNTNIEANIVMRPKLSPSANVTCANAKEFLCAMGKSMRYLEKKTSISSNLLGQILLCF